MGGDITIAPQNEPGRWTIRATASTQTLDGDLALPLSVGFFCTAKILLVELIMSNLVVTRCNRRHLAVASFEISRWGHSDMAYRALIFVLSMALAGAMLLPFNDVVGAANETSKKNTRAKSPNPGCEPNCPRCPYGKKSDGTCWVCEFYPHPTPGHPDGECFPTKK